MITASLIALMAGVTALVLLALGVDPPPPEKPQRFGWFIKWRSRETGFTSNGRAVYADEESCAQFCRFMNFQYRLLDHWPVGPVALKE